MVGAETPARWNAMSGSRPTWHLLASRAARLACENDEAPPSLTGLGHPDDSLQLPAASVESAAGARVAAAGALHHASTLLAGRPQIEALPRRRDHRRIVGQR